MKSNPDETVFLVQAENPNIISPEEFDRIYNIMDRLRGSILQAKETVLKSVLKQFLGREATIEDAKKCVFGSYINNREVEKLIYDGQELGIMKPQKGTLGEYIGYEFTPIHHKFYDDAERI